MSLLDDYVEHLDAGVRTGDWEPVLELLAPDAELEFTGGSRGAVVRAVLQLTGGLPRTAPPVSLV